MTDRACHIPHVVVAAAYAAETLGFTDSRCPQVHRTAASSTIVAQVPGTVGIELRMAR